MGGDVHFLIGDDDQDDRHFFAIALQSIDPSIICRIAKSGQEVLDTLKSEEVLPNVLFLDINMPNLNGWDVLLKIKKNPVWKAIPVIMYTTSSYKRDIELATEFGAIGFCTKPDDVNQLKIILKFIIDNINRLSENIIKNSGIEHFKVIEPGLN
ncbi:MAG: rcp1 3 [Bacteroidetes bacterium]|nr:rcp1 3 [Bacteroidota bacterium]